MTHMFEEEIACETGILEAVILQNIAFWVQKNEANHKHFHDGKYWTYNSKEAFAKLFPYATTNQIRRALEKLHAEGYIETGCYNEDARDRTQWYALTEKGKCIWQKTQMHRANLPNASGENAQSIRADNKQADINADNKSVGRMPKPTLEEVKAYCAERKSPVDPQRFYDYYSANGWKVGKNPMKDFRAAVRLWERNEQKDISKHFDNERKYGDDFFAKLEGRSK